MWNRMRAYGWAGAFVCGAGAGLLLAGAPRPVSAQEQRFTGGIQEDRQEAGAKPRPVRNDVARPGEEIVTLRHFRIRKGTFEQFLKASQEGVWPYFEKLGSRVIGMWVETFPVVDGRPVGQESPDHDDVYLMTRYASVEHWRATRDMAAHGGNGPDWAKCRDALALRQTLTIESSVKFLKGEKWENPPFFLPGLDEEYELVK
jgi:hypothetical protein